MKCTRHSALQNLTQRTDEEMDGFLRKRAQDLRRCDDLVTAAEPILAAGRDIAWEWPTTAVSG